MIPVPGDIDYVWTMSPERYDEFWTLYLFVLQGCEKISANSMVQGLSPSISGVRRPTVVRLKALTEL
jgi:hypothetical protein